MNQRIKESVAFIITLENYLNILRNQTSIILNASSKEEAKDVLVKMIKVYNGDFSETVRSLGYTMEELELYTKDN